MLKIDSYHKLSDIIYSRHFVWMIIGIGVLLRLIRYLHNTPLWFDESVYASDIIERPVADFIYLSKDFLQVQALGFYLYEKLAITIFGTSEYALRLFPFLFSTASLFLFYNITTRITCIRVSYIAVTLFSILDPLIYYSAELKPYSGDVFVSLLIIYLATHDIKELTIRHILMVTTASAFALLLSNPSIFVLGGVWAGLFLFSLQKGERDELRRLVIILIIWGLTFLSIYFLYTRSMILAMTDHVSLEKALEMEKFIMPFPPKSFTDIKWYIDFFFDTFLFQDSIMYVKRVTLSGLTAFAFLVGIIAMFLKNRKNFYILLSPILLTLLAAAMHQYPFKGRQILFLVPMFLLFISEGAEYVREKVSRNSLLIGAVFLGLLFIYPVSWAAYHTKKPLIRSEIRPVLTHIKQNWQNGDILYLHFFAQYEFEYYTKYHPDPFKFDKNEYVIGIGPRGWYDKWRRNKIPERYKNVDNQSRDDLLKEYIYDLNKVKESKRVWVVFTGDVTMEDFFLTQLDQIGTQQDSFGDSGRGITYLYDLSRN